jgi:hypothetical protein
MSKLNLKYIYYFDVFLNKKYFKKTTFIISKYALSISKKLNVMKVQTIKLRKEINLLNHDFSLFEFLKYNYNINFFMNFFLNIVGLCVVI